MAASTPTTRRIVVEAKQFLTHMRTLEHGSLPLTNPGSFKAGVYLGIVNPDGTATLTRDWRA